jgi:hypothetical protein
VVFLTGALLDQKSSWAKETLKISRKLNANKNFIRVAGVDAA